MALYVRLQTTNLEESKIVNSPINRTMFNNQKSRSVFYDPETGIRLTASSPVSKDISAYKTQYCSDGFTPKLINIGAAIQEGILTVDPTSTETFPAPAMGMPLLPTHLVGELCVIPGSGAGYAGNYYSIYMTASGISGELYSPSSRIKLANRGIYPKKNGFLFTSE